MTSSPPLRLNCFIDLFSLVLRLNLRGLLLAFLNVSLCSKVTRKVAALCQNTTAEVPTENVALVFWISPTTNRINHLKLLDLLAYFNVKVTQTAQMLMLFPDRTEGVKRGGK